MRIVRLQAEGFKRLVAVDITPEGDLIEVRGNNGEGKSSLLDSIFAAIGGSEGAPIKPVRTGEEFALIKLDLGGVKVTRYFDADGTTKLKVENADGAVYEKGQTTLDGLIGSISFDPLEFANMAAKDQTAEIRRLVKLDVDLDELKRADEMDFANRRDVNRDGKAVKARLEAIALPADLPDVLPDRAAIADELAKAADTNSAIEREVARRERREAEARECLRLADNADRVAEDLRQKLQDAIDAATEQRTVAKSIGSEVSSLPPIDAAIDVSALRSRMTAADALAVHGVRRDDKKRLTAEFDGLKAKSEALSKTMNDRADIRAKALAAAKMPVDGLSFAEFDGDLIVTLNGEPFEQASSADKLKTSVAIAMAANPKLRVLRIKDGSLLDKRNLDVLRATATEHDFQIWSEFVGDEGTGIIMEAGKVRGAAEPERATPPKRRAKAKPEADAVAAEAPAGALL